jgi:tight adherence protein B
MGLILEIVFLGVFGVMVLTIIAISDGAAQRSKKARVTLDSVLASGRTETRAEIPDFRKNERLSPIPWLNRKLTQIEMAPRLRQLIEQAGLKWTAGGLLASCGACFIVPASLAYMRFESVFLSSLAGALLGSAPVGWVIFKRNMRFSRFLEGLPEALDLMVGAIRAGHSLIAAMGLAARECPDPVGPEFKTCFDEQNYGLEMKAAMDNLVNRVPLQELRIVSTAIMIQKESGGNLAEVLDKTSHVIRERFRLKRQIGVHTAQGRLTGWILTILPIGLGIVLYISDPRTMSVLWTNPLGVKLLWASFVSLVIGSLIIRKIVNMDV